MSDTSLSTYPLVPCRICGEPLDGHAWHCMQCSTHNGLYYSECSLCEAPIHESCGIFEPMCCLPTLEFLLNYDSLPFTVTLVPTIEEFAELAEYRRQQQEEEDEGGTQ